MAVGHLVARCRAFLLELEATGQEIGGLGDPRAAALLEALAGTTIMPSPHSLRALEQQATELLLRLR